MSDDFRQKIKAFAARMVTLAPLCTDEGSTKLFLILPFLNFLGYDDRNPDEGCPEHSADFLEKYKIRVDFAILKEALPVIAIECKALGSSLKGESGQLRSYFNAARTVKLGIISDGMVYEFYADFLEPNMMDQNSFLMIDSREVAKGKIADSLEEGLKSLQKNNFDPKKIGAEAKRKLIFRNVTQQIAQLAEEPSETFVRMLLQNAGLSHVGTMALSELRDVTRSAFREFVNLRVLQQLDIMAKDNERENSIAPHKYASADATVERPKGQWFQPELTDRGTVLGINPDELVQLAPRLKPYLRKSEPDWPDIVDSADRLRHDLDVSQSLWGDACLAMGREQAAIALAFVSAKPAEQFTAPR
jgi:hypothetical protein